MFPRHVYLLSAALLLVACAHPAADRVPAGGLILADSDRHMIRSGQSAPMPLEEAPLFRIDPSGPPAAMTADAERRAPVPEAPRPITEEPQRR